MRAEVVDRVGHLSGAFVDSRCPGREFQVDLASRFHYLRHTGRTTAGSTITVFYVEPDSQVILYADSPTVRRSGTFRTNPTDLTAFTSIGQMRQVVVHHEDPGPSAQQDLIEYALLAGIINP